MKVGDVVTTKHIQALFGNAVFRGAASYKALPSERMVFLFCGSEPEDGSNPLDVSAFLEDLGWQRTPEFQAEVDARQKQLRERADKLFAETGLRTFKFFYSWAYRRPTSKKRHSGDLTVEGKNKQDAERNFAARTSDRREVQVLRIVEVVPDDDGERMVSVPPEEKGSGK